MRPVCHVTRHHRHWRGGEKSPEKCTVKTDSKTASNNIAPFITLSMQQKGLLLPGNPQVVSSIFIGCKTLIPPLLCSTLQLWLVWSHLLVSHSFQKLPFPSVCYALEIYSIQGHGVLDCTQNVATFFFVIKATIGEKESSFCFFKWSISHYSMHQQLASSTGKIHLPQFFLASVFEILHFLWIRRFGFIVMIPCFFSEGHTSCLSLVHERSSLKEEVVI